MISIPRNLHENGFFHVMTQGLNKEYIFNKDYYKDKYIKLMKKYAKSYNVLILAYCIMDNHSHLLVYTEEVKQLSRFMQNINSKFAVYYNKDISRVGYVFRGRYNRQFISDRNYLLNCLNYIHMNPVKANIIDKPEDYKYSTYNDYLNKKGIVDENVLRKMFVDKENYLDTFLNISDKDFEVMDIDREEKNLEIATNTFMEENNVTLDEIKQDRELLHKYCVEVIVNKKYKQVQISKLLNISKSTVSKYTSCCGETDPNKKFHCN